MSGTDPVEACYACDEAATSREHAPPKCFFPEQKDQGDKDRRRNLITVPSCAAHNISMSKDDEYALAVVAAHFEANPVANKHYATKLERALGRSPKFLSRILEGSVPASLEGQHTRALKIDRGRFDKEMEKIARAVHFHEFSTKWGERMAIHSSAFRGDDLGVMPEVAILDALASKAFKGAPKRGENPDVFFYQIVSDAELEFTMIRMSFYEGFHVVALSSPRVLGALKRT